ncbi:putative TIM-barrel fold metal-dependent hydrolase [Burkholderia sp. Ch1-1]|uniref:Putative TIM-barrel fold metal-dependent hydrolase n=1 Tax=Paraburkholderia dioscoreae TaxID=2604047 RepID=A0A5Q4ZKE9_9BURK|nr:amidohydrolase family protein [Paraburkholderia dioscoreae]EIF31661.1 putative TIM-barrel fold metal-dependent hydrolase [Burkholderia sp. Ch1-1]VVD28060.1 putative TIM-barrel fold metal-dependent hydrolase [Paraburkholderia dioscoreae]
MQDAQPRWPLDDVFVIDSTVHGYNTTLENHVDGIFKERVAIQLSDTLYAGHSKLIPDGDPKWALSRERFRHAADPDLMAQALFAESQTDVCIYHGTPLYGIYRDGGSPLSVGRAMRERYPDRVALYGPVSPWQPDALDLIDQLVEEDKVVGLKFYPMDLVDGEVKSYRLDDPEIAFPLLEKARKLGVKMIATHKAIPQGQVPSEPFAPFDVAGAATAFPDLTFEVVHGGIAFLEETAWQMQRFPNVTVNLEGSSAYLLQRSPRRFAELLGSLLVWGGEDRIFWATGCVAHHPRPFIELFWDFQIPDDMCEGFGYPKLTEAMKRQILGLNHARFLGWNVAALRQRLAGDEFGRLAALAPPWSQAAQQERAA